MKRSEINRALKELEAMCVKYSCFLPPFCHFTPEQWKTIGHEYDEVRDWNRDNIPNYKEIYVRVTRDTLISRNKKKLYTEGKNVMGVDLPFDEPKHPDIIIDNDGDRTPKEIVEELTELFNV